MQFLITFLEGIVSFISPCMLPMLPVYISYFAAGTDRKSRVLLRSFAFVLGFTLVFSLLGLFSGTVGAWLAKYKTAVRIIGGLLVVLFGLSYLDVIRLPFFKGMQSTQKVTGVFTAFLFGVVYSVSLTPCIGAFLGSALMLASTSGTALRGTLLLVTYSLGLGIPFFLSSVLLDKLRTSFNFIKAHYRVINLVCGIFLIVIGLLMVFGIFDTLLSFLS